MKKDLNDAIAVLGLCRDVVSGEIRKYFSDEAPSIRKVNLETFKLVSVLLVSCEAAKNLGKFSDKEALILLNDELDDFMQSQAFKEAEVFAQSPDVNGLFMRDFKKAKAFLEEIIED